MLTASAKYLKAMRKTISAISRTGAMSPDASGTFTKDSTIFALQHLQSPPQTAIYEPSMEFDSFGQTSGAAAVHSVLTQYLTHWFGFPVMQTWDFDFPATILIVDEIHLPTLLAQRLDYLDKPARQIIIIMCANPARQSTLSRDIRSSQVELICKPFGPFKLAKTLNRALEKAARTPSVGTPVTLASLSRLPGIKVTSRSSSVSSRASSAATASSRRQFANDATQHGSVKQPFKKSRSRGKEADGYPFPVVGAPVASDSSQSSIQSEEKGREYYREKMRRGRTIRDSEQVKKPEEPDLDAATHGLVETDPGLRPNALADLKNASLAPGGSFSGSDEPKILAVPTAASFPSTKESNTLAPSPSSSFQSTNAGALGIWDAPSSEQTRKPRLLLVVST